MDIKKLLHNKYNKKEKIQLLDDLGYKLSNFDKQKIIYEDLILTSYMCTSKVWTIGIGCTSYKDGKGVKNGDTISLNECIELYNYHKRKIEISLRRHFNSEEISRMGIVRFNVLLDLAYNLGVHKLINGFPALIRNIKKGDFKRASLELKFANPDKFIVSNYYKQVGNRAVENVKRLERG